MVRKRGVPPSPGQLSILDFIKEGEALKETTPQPGSFNISTQIRAALSEGLRFSGLSRYEVAARMSEMLDTEVTKTQLDSWTAESKELHRFPAEYMAAFCYVTGYKEPLRVMARLVQCHIVESEEALQVELFRIGQAKKDLLKREKSLRDMLDRISGQ